MTLSEFYKLPKEERERIMLEVARMATEAQLNTIKQSQEKDYDKETTTPTPITPAP